MGKKRRHSAQKSLPVESPVVEASKRPKKVAMKKNKTGAIIPSHLSYDIIREVVGLLKDDKSILSLAQSDRECRSIVENHLCTPITLHCQQLFGGDNPLNYHFFDPNADGEANNFHKDVRRWVVYLEGFVKQLKSRKNCIEGLDSTAFGWYFEHSPLEVRRCPHLLQRRIVSLISRHFQGSPRAVYRRELLRPSRFVHSMRNRLDLLTHLDLGNAKALQCLKLYSFVFPRLNNLTHLIWHNAEHWFLGTMKDVTRLKSLCVTLNQHNLDMDTLAVFLNCQKLENLYIGFHVPDNPTRFDMDVLLRTYQAFWNNHCYWPADMMIDNPVPIRESVKDKGSDYSLRAYPMVRKLGFWNAPEYLFVILEKLSMSVEELQFGQLNQDFSRLCSIDSVMQALFKIDLPKYHPLSLRIDRLKLFLHAMPVVTLDYYLPQMLSHLGRSLHRLKSLEMYVHCTFSSSMPSSWCIEGRPRKIKPKLEELTEFALHSDGFFVVDDLDAHLPHTLERLKLSFVIPSNKRKRFLTSLLKFIVHIGNINRFPELESLQIQVWGIRCFEPVINSIMENLPSLRHLSVITMPVSENTESIKDLIGEVSRTCSKLHTFGLSADMIKFLLTQEQQKRPDWKNVVAELRTNCDVQGVKCEIIPTQLPDGDEWNSLFVKPQYPDAGEEEEDYDEEEMVSDSTNSKTDDDEEEEEDSFIVNSDQEMEEPDASEDELDEAERRLHREDERRHRRAQARMRSESPDGTESDHVEEDEDLDDYLEDEEEPNSFLDDQAEEVSDVEDDEEISEPEGEDLGGSDDEELLARQIELVNARPHRPTPKRRRRIISSSDEE